MTVWITGASSGLGLHTAHALRDAGHTVIAGARSFRIMKQDGMYCLPLDVTDAGSIEAFCRSALRLSPRVDALVHCAGMLVLGSCEETSPEEYQRVMNANFLGMVQMNQAALPLMRAQGQGRIVMFSSINGLMGIPFQSAYTASKHAVEGYAECLAMEVRPFGVQVCLVEPGDHRSGSQRYRLQASAMTETSPYAEDFQRGTAVIHRDEAHGSDPDALGRKVAALLERRRMPLRRCIASPDQYGAALLHRLLPGNAFSGVIRRYYLGRMRRKTP